MSVQNDVYSLLSYNASTRIPLPLAVKTANINVRKLTSLKLIVRTMLWYHSTKTAKKFLV